MSFVMVPNFCQRIPFCRPHPTSGMNHANNEVHDTPEQTNSKSRVRKDSWGPPPPRKIILKIFGYGVFFPKNADFHLFHWLPAKKFCRSIARSLSMPLIIHIACSKLYTTNFSGVPLELTRCHQFGLQVPPKSGNTDFLPPKQAIFGADFGRNQFSWPCG